MSTNSKSNNKLIYSYNGGAKAISPLILSSYAESLIFDGDKRTIWHKGRQFGNSYFGSEWGESNNDFLHNTATGTYSHAEGTYTVASGRAAHAEGGESSATGQYAHAEGEETRANGEAAHAEGTLTNANGFASHAEGEYTYAEGDFSHAEGIGSKANTNYSHAEGQYTLSEGLASHAEGINTASYGFTSHAEGLSTASYGLGSHTEGNTTVAEGQAAHAEGNNTVASGAESHAEGLGSRSVGVSSHAEGEYTYANGVSSHAEGEYTYANGESSHAEGNDTTADGKCAHAEGERTFASGEASHAEGWQTSAAGKYSHAEGYGTATINDFELAIGRFNEPIKDKTIFTIGDGTRGNVRHNMVAVTWESTYISHNTYFGDHITGSVTPSYIDKFGNNFNIESIITALADEPVYHKPVFYTKFIGKTTNDGTWDFTTYTASYLANNKTVDVEIGTYFHPGIHLYWPSYDQNPSIATRTADDDVNKDIKDLDEWRLGYSKGVNTSNGMSFEFNYGDSWIYAQTETNGEMTFSEVNKDETAAAVFTYIINENDYNVVDNIKVSYLESTYMVFHQFRKAGQSFVAYGEAPNNWFTKRTSYAIPGKFVVRGRYRWYMGTSNSLPTSKTDLTQNYVSTGLLNKDSASIYTDITHSISEHDTQSSYMWVAVPENFTYTATENGLYADFWRKDNVHFDLASPITPLETGNPLYITLGMNNRYVAGGSKKYNLYYIWLKLGTISDGSSSDRGTVKFRIKGSKTS